MNSDRIFKIIELFLLFIVLPGLLATSLLTPVKLSLVLLGLTYVSFITYKNRTNLSFKLVYKKPVKPYVIRITIVAVLLVVLGVLLIQFVNPDLLFRVVRQKPMLWVTILFVYAFLSVIPQELVYRRFFYERYQYLFANKRLFFTLNVFCFSWCHIFLHNIWVMGITLIAGIFFAFTYEKEKSLRWVIIEHSLYGNLIFTLGLGEVLAFPV